MDVFNKKVLIIFLIAVFLFLVSADLLYRNSEPGVYEAPGVFCETRFRGITLPPVGIFLCPDFFNDPELRAHEMVHWDQYKDSGAFGFYLRYIWGMFEAGFDYDLHHMEIEAENRVRGL